MSQLEFLPKEKRSAVFSPCRVYRYALEIVWDDSLKLCQFIGLNPSTADEYQDDPTVRRCKCFSREWGYGGLVMTNLFAYRDTDPEKMKAFEGDPVSEPVPEGVVFPFQNHNDYQLRLRHDECGITIAAWGKHGSFKGRSDRVRKIIPTLHALRFNNDGSPEHPLYLPGNLTPIPYPNMSAT